MDKYISLYQICKELADEAGKELDEQQFKNYYDQKKDEFKEILASLGVEPETFRNVDNNSFQIPIDHSGTIKMLLNSYTSKELGKKIRKQKYFDMDFKGLEEIVKQVDSLLVDGLDTEKQLTERSKLFTITRYVIRQAITEVQSAAIEQVLRNIEEMKTFFTFEDKWLNDSDKAHLIRYYGQLIKEANDKWHTIVDIYEGLRSEEIIEQSMQMVDNSKSDYPEDNMPDLQLDEPYLVLWQAIQEYRNDQSLIMRETPIKKPTKEQLELVEKSIEELKQRRNH